MVVLILKEEMKGNLDTEMITYYLKENATIKEFNILLYKLKTNITYLIVDYDIVKNKQELKDVLLLYKAQTESHIVLCTRQMETIQKDFEEVTNDIIEIDNKFIEDINGAVKQKEAREQAETAKEEQEQIDQHMIEEDWEKLLDNPQTKHEEKKHVDTVKADEETTDLEIHNSELDEIDDNSLDEIFNDAEIEQDDYEDEELEELEEEQAEQEIIKKPNTSIIKKLSSILVNKQHKVDYTKLKTIGIMGTSEGVGTHYSSILLAQGLSILGRNTTIINLTGDKLILQNIDFKIHNIEELNEIFKFYNEYDHLIFLCGDYFKINRNTALLNTFMTSSIKLLLTSYLPYKVAETKEIDEKLYTNMDYIGVVGMPSNEEDTKGNPELISIPFCYALKNEKDAVDFTNKVFK